MSRAAICVFSCSEHHNHGVAHITETYPNGPLRIDLSVYNIAPGDHGFHLHQSGNELHAPESLCAHFNPTGANHGDLNDPRGHYGDFGNITVDASGNCRVVIVANFVRMNDVLGRSLIIHQDKDDLGRGHFPDSLTSGHSGKRLLWGIVGVDVPC